jgi:anti-sigma regulatory factor (Ser/Thr protein kinase)
MRVTINVPSVGGNLASVRKVVHTWAEVVHAEATSLQLIATELVSNAIGVSPPETSVLVTLDHLPGRVEVSVADHGPGLLFEAETLDLPSPAAQRGRGLPIVAALVDELALERRGDRTVVTARKFTAI